MTKNKEYTREEMFQWLEKYYKDDKWEVKPYSPEFLPARVPLYCIKEGQFGWSKVPGEHNDHFKLLLKKYLDPDFVENAVISKIEGDKVIKVSGDKKLVTVTVNEKEAKLCIEIDGDRTFNPMVEQKKDQLYIYDEVVVELTTARKISEDEFFPKLPISRENMVVNISEASPVRFYQYYFPKAKLYYAYPDYVEENDEFNNFRKICINRGIGLLKTSKNGIEIVIESHSLFDEICGKLIDTIKKPENIRNIIGTYLENYLHYLVYYPDPQYRRSAIIEEKPGKISRFLIDKLVDCKNIEYKDILKDLSNSYRDKREGDYDIVVEYNNKLWKSRIGLEYPDIARHLEEILLRNERYRDHFVHQFQVFLIGSYILEKMYDTKGFVKVLKSFKEDYKCKIEDAWLLASTYHDFNYGLQNFDIWLMQFFNDTLSINNEEAKENLNTLNLDSVMVRESFSNIIIKMVELLHLDEDSSKKAIKFFYEKSVRDRNHGLLSALSILKLCEIKKSNLMIKSEALLQAALAIACHDEDIWEALCGCKGYLRKNDKCEGKCERPLLDNKKLAIYKKIISTDCDRNCEIWEQEFMKKSIFQKIKFKNNPLMFLLIFCDVVQEEGRITGSSIGDNSISNYRDFETKISDLNFNTWCNSDKKFEEFEQSNKTQADEIRTEFTKNGHKISKDARIYKIAKTSKKKWKILNGKILYEIVRKEGSKTILSILPRETECLLNKINVSLGKVDVDLTIDGLWEKSKELLRVSWALEDKRFKIHLKERDTIEYKNLEINGSGGG